MGTSLASHHVNGDHSMVTIAWNWKGSYTMDSNLMREDPTQQTEGTLARTIEQQTAKLPSDTFLWLAVGAMGTSAALQMSGNRNLSLFFGQWVPAFLLFGVYNKLVKQLGSDRYDRGGSAQGAYGDSLSSSSSAYDRGLGSTATSLS